MPTRNVPTTSLPEALRLAPEQPDGVAVTLVATAARDAVVSREAARHFTSVHVWEWVARVSSRGSFTATPPKASEEALRHLDADGRVRVGARVVPGDILVGAKEPHVGLEGPQEETEDDRSLRCPPDAGGEVTAVTSTKEGLVVTVRAERALAVGDLLSIDEQSVCVVGAIVDTVSGGDIAWPGASGPARVKKRMAVIDALEARSVGPYSLVTRQPLGGKDHYGAQRLGPRALNALLDRGATLLVHEMLTVKSDDAAGRTALYESILAGQPACRAEMPLSTEVLEVELRAMGFDVDFRAERPSLAIMTTASIRALAPAEVTQPDTLQYETFAPVPGGLFCTEIFGALGTRDRRTRLGRIELPLPAMHPSAGEAVAVLLGWTSTELERRLDGETLEGGESRPGGVEVREALAKLDVDALAGESSARGQLVRDLTAAGLVPSDLFVEAWPILPPDLRPMVPLSGGRYATSDLNDLYRRLINRTNRVRRLVELNAPPVIIVNESRMMQEALDAAVHNGTTGNAVTAPDKRPLISLSQLVGGEEGRLRTLSEGKRVDYSGRAIVVENDALPAHAAFVPRRMAAELFRPWVYRELAVEGIETRLAAAKRLVTERHPGALAALERVAPSYPVVLLPDTDGDAAVSVDLVLWDEAAIGLRSETISALGLTPGDAVAIHVPIDPRAKDEARARLRGHAEAVNRGGDEGWLARASRAPIEQLGALLFDVALRDERDPATGRVARLILGRQP